jgi:NAD-dependent deacetylase
MSLEISGTMLDRLMQARSVVAFTGAGVSAESGVPTFRSPEGIWAKFKPEELASMGGFMRNPELVWEWYAHRKRIMRKVRPNPGHEALARLERLVPRLTVVTQNIDGLHHRAGSSAVLELHGSIERNYCMACGRRHSNEEVLAGTGVPHCLQCGGMVRPDVVWFGEQLPEEEWEGAVRVSGAADVFYSIGTSAVVYPAASLPLVALDAGAYVVEVNPEPTPLTQKVHEFLQGAAGAVLPAIVHALEQRKA